MKYFSVGALRLQQNLAAVGYEKQTWAAPVFFAQPAIVECCHNGLARTCGCDEQILMSIVDLSLRAHCLQHFLLVRVGLDAETRELERF